MFAIMGILLLDLPQALIAATLDGYLRRGIVPKHLDWIFNKVLKLSISYVIPVLKATQNVSKANNIELFVVSVFGLALKFLAVVAGSVTLNLRPDYWIMIDQREIVLHSDIMNLLETTRYHADMFETLLLEFLDKES
jgi:hypothetical protein